ncbi:MAG: site-specific integrase, partial [Oscillibacter sp.]|nr:site-specific integrase [Oscillibacter sp.]
PGLSPKTIRGIHMMLHSALEQAVKEELIKKNPTNDCNPPKVVKKEMKVIRPEQIGAYLQAAANRNVLPMFYLELTSGLRRGELLALLWTDLDLDRHTISVSKSVLGRNGELKVSAPKTRHSIRTVVIPQQTVDLLIQEHNLHPDNPYMFPSPVTDTMYHPDAATRIHRKLLKEAGIEHIRFHDLRHTFATLALQNGVDVKTLSGMLGHYSSGFTLDTYTHITDRMQQEAAEKVGSFMEMTF